MRVMFLLSEILDHLISYAVVVRTNDTEVLLLVNPEGSADAVFLEGIVDILYPVDG